MDANQETGYANDISSASASVDLVRNDRPFVMLPIVMTSMTGMCIKDLNEYCLLKIFSNNSLTLIDLCSLAETCKHFKQIIQRVFPKEFGITSAAITNGKYSKSYREQDVERIVKNFGSRLVALSLCKADQTVVKSVAEYCGDVTLKRLEVCGMNSFDSLKVQLQSILPRLLTLSIDDCDLIATSADLNCESLVELEIVQSTGCVAILKNNFPKLKRFTFRYNEMSDNNDGSTATISEFIDRHRSLAALKLVGSSIRFSSELVHAIGNNHKELEELTLRVRRPEISFEVFNLMSLSKLKTLDIYIDVESYNQSVALLQASSLLETVVLYFDNDVPYQIFDVLSRQQHLRELTLYFCSFASIPWTLLTQLRKLRLFARLSKFRTADLFSIVRQLKNLEELELRGNVSVLSTEDYFEIAKIVDPRPHVLTLKCRCNIATLL